MAIKIAPSFLTANLGRLADEVRAVEQAGADYLHLDVMDGHFVPPISFGPIVVEAIRRVTTLPLDIHLMIEQPERQLEAFAQAASPNTTIINVHIEACPDLPAILQQIKALGCRAGVGLSPDTPISAIEGVLDAVDQVLVMGVQPGWGGQALIPATLPKVRDLRALLSERGLATDIEIDGGLKVDNAASCAQAGANVLVAGSVIFNDAAPVADNMAALRNALAAVEAKL
ncbi:MAG: ribulose-phosphate 3-epimerase [Chloroflexi bacterium]|nr:ribulose-phosphate 3-epimerase [Chloroflexota bacterium]